MPVTLGGITLPDDLVWIDEFDHDPVAQAAQRTLGGVHVLEETELVEGRPITLGADEQWITRTTLLELQALAADAGQTHTLNLRGVEYTVAFRRPAFRARPVIPFADPDAGDQYAVQINLMTV
ncbi:MAG: hypothetical protein ACPGJF_03375 [Sinimarinibacterium flocculans]|uniref:hypothetical protein n=1 Tax=Sinimarinibacterium flocculans TaxID=985250 RepID=UPI003C365548